MTVAEPILQLKKCRVCGQVKPLTDFSNNATKPGGKQSECKTCNTASVKERQHYNRGIIQGIKLERGCEECGYKTTIPRELHFHHVDPDTKNFELKEAGRPLESLLAEIELCIVLCCSCHSKLEPRRKSATSDETLPTLFDFQRVA